MINLQEASSESLDRPTKRLMVLSWLGDAFVYCSENREYDNLTTRFAVEANELEPGNDGGWVAIDTYVDFQLERQVALAQKEADPLPNQIAHL